MFFNNDFLFVAVASSFIVGGTDMVAYTQAMSALAVF